MENNVVKTLIYLYTWTHFSRNCSLYAVCSTHTLRLQMLSSPRPGCFLATTLSIMISLQGEMTCSMVR